MRVGNVDGTNGDDLIWVDETGLDGRTYVAQNNGSGGFSAPRLVFDERLIETPEPYVGDFNNDGNADLLLIQRTADTNELIVGFGFSDDQDNDRPKFSFPAGLQRHPNTPTEGWDVYDEIFIGDVNGDTKADVVWTNPSSDAKIYVALSK